MSELNSPPKECEFRIAPSGKLICKTHEQALIYVYASPTRKTDLFPVYRFVCQVGEDEIADAHRDAEMQMEQEQNERLAEWEAEQEFLANEEIPEDDRYYE